MNKSIPASVAQVLNDAKPIYIDIDNVARWFYSVNEQEIYDITSDFPSLLIPWPISEWRFFLPREINQEGRMVKTPASLEYTIRALIMPTDNEAIKQNLPRQIITRLTGKEPPLLGDSSGLEYTISEAEKRECRYTLLFNVSLLKRPFVKYSLFLDESGKPIGRGQVFPSTWFFQVAGDRADDFSPLFPVFFATSLLHCKNVDLIDLAVTRQARRLAERKGEPVIQYKTLIIEPFKKQVRSEARQHSQSEIHRALHICRGHFKEYSEERPLFGKYAGRFWFPMHARGSKEHGEVRKDYKVIADDDTTPSPA